MTKIKKTEYTQYENMVHWKLKYCQWEWKGFLSWLFSTFDESKLNPEGKWTGWGILYRSALRDKIWSEELGVDLEGQIKAM